MSKLPFWKKQNKSINKQFSIRLTSKELAFVKAQSEIDCCSMNSFIRKCIKKQEIRVNSDLD